MDWSGVQHLGPVLIPYPQVVKNVKKVANHVTRFILFLEKFGMNLDNLTLIGHSLGAHVAGITGYDLRSRINRVIGKVYFYTHLKKILS